MKHHWPQVDARLLKTIAAINAFEWKRVGEELAACGNPLVAAVLLLAATESAACIVPTDVVLNNVDNFKSN